MDLERTPRIVFRATILNNATLAANLSNRIFGDWVDDQVPFPYLTMEYHSGGWMTDTIRRLDVKYIIAVHSHLEQEALTNRELLSDALHHVWPIFPASIVSLVAQTHWIEEMTSYQDRSQRQNIQFFKKGGLFRLRLHEILV